MQLNLSGLDAETRSELEERMDAWEREGAVGRLWSGDAALWSNADEARWLGWLGVLDAWRSGAQSLDGLGDELCEGRLDGEPLEHVVVMGMGGSSLCADVLRQTFGRRPDSPELLVLDSTVPAQLLRVRESLDPKRSLFIVPSKSGSTIEPNCFKAYFFEEVESLLGPGLGGSRFLAITDPDTQLDALSQREAFAARCHGLPEIGGRFSALSVFGMVPASLMGIDVERFLDRARVMAAQCGADRPPRENPGVALGLLLGVLARRGRDKLTLVLSPSLRSLGSWLEQLVAESTGKHGVGIVPVDGEALASPERYGDDRLFVSIALAGDEDSAQNSALAALESAGQPVLRFELAEAMDLGQELFRWEIATAVAGAVLGINPFDQPDVEAAKVVARDLMDRFESEGSLPAESASLEDDGLALFGSASGVASLEAALGHHIDTLRPGDYFGIHAYLDMNPAIDAQLQRLRHAVRDARTVATTVGYGPRFLHSSGQLHKGGPNTGVFLQLTGDDPQDVPIPGQRYSFGVLKNAQAGGDFQVLAERGRRILRIHLGVDTLGQLDRLNEIVERSLDARAE